MIESEKFSTPKKVTKFLEWNDYFTTKLWWTKTILIPLFFVTSFKIWSWFIIPVLLSELIYNWNNSKKIGMIFTGTILTIYIILQIINYT